MCANYILEQLYIELTKLPFNPDKAFLKYIKYCINIYAVFVKRNALDSNDEVSKSQVNDKFCMLNMLHTPIQPLHVIPDMLVYLSNKLDVTYKGNKYFMKLIFIADVVFFLNS